jgi:hypothetical protein
MILGKDDLGKWVSPGPHGIINKPLKQVFSGNCTQAAPALVKSNPSQSNSTAKSTKDYSSAVSGEMGYHFHEQPWHMQPKQDSHGLKWWRIALQQKPRTAKGHRRW